MSGCRDAVMFGNRETGKPESLCFRSFGRYTSDVIDPQRDAQAYSSGRYSVIGPIYSYSAKSVPPLDEECVTLARRDEVMARPSRHRAISPA